MVVYAKSIWKKNKMGGATTFNFQTYYIALVIKIFSDW